MTASGSRLEKSLGLLLRRFRELEIDPIRRRVEAVEERAAFEARLAAVERRLGVDTVEAKFHRGDPVSESEWYRFCE